MSHPRFLWAALAIAATFGLLAAGCGDDDGGTATPSSTTTDSPPPSTSPPSTSPPSTSPPSTTPPTTDTVPSTMTAEVGVYFVASVGQPAGGGVVDALAASTRAVEVGDDATPEEAAGTAMAALLAGPTAFETEIGYSSAVPADTELLGVTVDGGVASVDLSGEFETASGALTDTLRIAQVVFTLTAIDGIDAVVFEIDGTVRDVIGTHGVAVDAENGAVRDDLPEARPPILVESPAPGAVLGDSLTVRGEANTFEANVRWTLTDPDGEIVDEGFTTATAGTGTWGTYEFTVDVPSVDRDGLGALILWEPSAKDGSQTNIVEVPVEYAGS